MRRSLFDLTGKTALITGSSRGIGLTIARGLAEAGAMVVLNGRSAVSLEAAAENVRRAGFVAHAIPFDVTDETAVNRAIAAIEDDIAPIDVLVNNAGIQRRAPLRDFATEDWRALLDTNLTSAFFVGRAVGARMCDRRRGKIINVCSLQSELARPTIAAYSATKGALKMLTRGMCADWAQYGLCVNGIGPGYFATEMTSALRNDPEFDGWVKRRTPAGRWGLVVELVGPVVFLASSASDFVNGQIVYVDGGMLAVV